MKLCFIAAANSIHTRRWVEYFCKPENEVHILSTTKNPEPIQGAIIHDLFTGELIRSYNGSVVVKGNNQVSKGLRRWILSSRLGRAVLEKTYSNIYMRDFWLPYQTFRIKGRAKAIVEALQPDLVHCLRLPIEGYIGGYVYYPLVISSWGDDFVFHATKLPLCRRLTRNALLRASVHFADNARDKDLAEIYGFSSSKPAYIMPGCGGLKLEQFPMYRKDNLSRERIGVAADTNLLLSVRGFKSPFLNNEALIKALPQIVRVFPNTLCILVGDTRSPGYLQLRRLAEELKMEEYVRFVNQLKFSDLMDYLTASDITVSVSLYDGLPNSMLESMACGAIPVMSSHCAIQEWIADGWNGYLFNPRDPEDIARVVVRALRNKDNFQEMRKRNWDLIAERADYYRNMKLVEGVYHQVIDKRKAPHNLSD